MSWSKASERGSPSLPPLNPSVIVQAQLKPAETLPGREVDPVPNDSQECVALCVEEQNEAREPRIFTFSHYVVSMHGV
jgi:hypothetical protein